MRRLMIVAAAIALLGAVPVFAAITGTVVKNPDETRQVIFNLDGKEIAKQLEDAEGNVIQTEGTLPEEAAKAYYDGGKVKIEWKFKNSMREGVTTEYFESGTVQRQLSYKMNKLDAMEQLKALGLPARPFFYPLSSLPAWDRQSTPIAPYTLTAIGATGWSSSTKLTPHWGSKSSTMAKKSP